MLSIQVSSSIRPKYSMMHASKCMISMTKQRNLISKNHFIVIVCVFLESFEIAYTTFDWIK